MTDQTELKPPPKYAHLPYHWICSPHKKFIVYEWENNGQWWTRTGDEQDFSTTSFIEGWQYHGPCSPAAIIPDPTNEAMVECVMNVLRSENAESSDPVMIRKVIRLYARRVLIALASL